VKYIIDRFEGDYAVCEDENVEFINIGRKFLPEGAVEGSSFYMDANGRTGLTDDSERRKRIESKMKKIWK